MISPTIDRHMELSYAEDFLWKPQCCTPSNHPKTIPLSSKSYVITLFLVNTMHNINNTHFLKYEHVMHTIITLHNIKRLWYYIWSICHLTKEVTKLFFHCHINGHAVVLPPGGTPAKENDVTSCHSIYVDGTGHNITQVISEFSHDLSLVRGEISSTQLIYVYLSQVAAE